MQVSYDLLKLLFRPVLAFLTFETLENHLTCRDGRGDTFWVVEASLAHFCRSLDSCIWQFHTRFRWWHEGPPLAGSAADCVRFHWYRETGNTYLRTTNQLKLATGPYKVARDAYVAATAACTKSLYEKSSPTPEIHISC